MLYIQKKMERIHKNVIKLQKAFKRCNFMMYIRKICIMKMIQDIAKDFANTQKDSKKKSPKKTKTKDPRSQFYETLNENT